MDSALIASAALLGLASAPHCTVMCSAPCAAAISAGGVGATSGFHLARVGSYAVAGAVAAASVSALASWSQFSPALRPLWTLLHAAALVLGLYLLWRGRQPAWLAGLGRGPALPAAPPVPRSPWRAAAAGSLWASWPCGLLQSALLVASMTSGAAEGAIAMAAFALASSPGLLLAPWIWRRVLAGDRAGLRERWATRGAGLLLAAASTFALGHGVWARFAAFCATL